MIRFLFAIAGSVFSWVTTALVAAGVCAMVVLGLYGSDLPSADAVRNYEPPVISRIYSGEGRILGEVQDPDGDRRLFVPIEDIPPLVQNAFIAAEDGNFREHGGFDPRAIASAVRDLVVSRGEVVRGGSGITQQVVKNFIVGGGRNVERKLEELLLSVQVETILTKDEILELYLNEIYLGQQSAGVAAAAEAYFDKNLDELSVAEAAYLAVLPRRPSGLHPVNNRDRVIRARDNVLREMHENGFIDRAAYEEALEDPLRTVQGGDYPSFRAGIPDDDYFTAEVRRQIVQDYGREALETDGLTIRATVDPDMQRIAEEALQRALEDYDRSLGRWRGTGERIEEAALEDWQAALRRAPVPRDVELEGPWLPAVVLEVADQSLRLGIEGREEGDPAPVVPREDIAWMQGSFFDNFERGDVVLVRRMTADADGGFIRWTLRQVPEVQGAFMAMDVNTGRVIAMQGGFSVQDSVFNRATQAQRQPGSSFKPFVYAAALDSGYTPATIVVDAPIEVDTGNGVWRPQNASNQFYGPTPLRTGIEQSRNLMTIRLAQEVGMDVVAGYAERFGVYDDMNPFLANSLGSEETTLFRMVAAYSMFANGGERVEPTLVDRVQDRMGRTIYRHDQRICLDCNETALPAGAAPQVVSDRARVMDPVTAYQLTSMMQGVTQRGTARGVGAALDVPVAGKTGTTNDAKDVWFVGFTNTIAAGCYIGYDTPRSLGRGASGGGMCGPVFTRFMSEAVERYGAGPFEIPEGGTFINIDRVTGARLPDGSSGENVIAEYFRLGEEPIFGLALDGGWAMGSDLQLFSDGGGGTERQVTTSTGETVTVAPRASFGSLSSGGLY
ncbi:penicillin-binding protein 1A [Hasllibacter halocynthiae]|uniref:Penicillin-binding protein 1A n=1 Tax=Hasllibacter halocynthiae TaxID=595589 RepID=A0A2T0X7P0_9RHOB|nr:PBP1A family penicillin-binding protein [Hasllibacter halocynthiae]PRY94946.1 penicillin-binding protein 1A [Hasllibacter halocynthiae]